MNYVAFVLYVLGAFQFHQSLRIVVAAAVTKGDPVPPVMPTAMVIMAMVWPFMTFTDLLTKD
jgi:hypothetical protein